MALPAHSLPACSQVGVKCISLPGPLAAHGALVNKYLDKLLGASRPPSNQLPPTLDTLNTLLAAHVDRVAYENVDIQAGRPPPALDPVGSVRLIAEQHRGSYCFVLVEAFAALLRVLGFRVSLHPSGCGEEPPGDSEWGNHVVAAVHFLPQELQAQAQAPAPDRGRSQEVPRNAVAATVLRGDATSGRRYVSYVADVGLGEGPREAWLVPNGSPGAEGGAGYKWTEGGFEYGMHRVHPSSGSNPEGGGVYFWRNDRTALPFAGFNVSFDSSAAAANEFNGFHRHLWTAAESHFVHSGVIIHRKTKDEVLSLRGCVLRRTHPSLPSTSKPAHSQLLAVVETRAEWFAMVEREFGVRLLADLSEAEATRLWNSVEAAHRTHLAKTTASRDLSSAKL
jgi:N-hydroxyarylamine O-acetyltransferase